MARERITEGTFVDDFDVSAAEGLKWLRETVGLNFSDIETRWKEFPVIVAPQYVSEKYGPDQPHRLYGYLTQIRLAYTIGADSAAIALCRATTELLIRDHYPSDLNIKNDLSGLIRSVQSLPRFAFLKKYHLTDKVQEAHDILHGRSLGGSTVDMVRHQHRARGLVRDWVIVLDEMISKAPASGLPTTSPRPELAQGTLASQRSDAAIGSRTQRKSSDSATNRVDEVRPIRPMEVAQPSSPSLGQRFAALLPLTAGFAAVLAIAGVSLYVLVYLLVPPADEKLAATTALTLKASLTAPEDTPAAAMPAPVKPPEEAVPIVAVAPGALAPGAAPAVAMPAPAAPPEEPRPIVAVAPGALAPGTVPALAIPAPAAPSEEVAPIVAVAPGALALGTAPALARPAPVAPPEELRASTAEISALLARGDSLFGVGDVASARLFYERATDAGDAQAALRLGETYDPFFLMRARLNGVRGNLAVATRWYRRARDLGASEAEILLRSVENR